MASTGPGEQRLRLAANNIRHHYGATEVIRDVSLTVTDEQIVCLVGPSGCGKSTLLRFLGGLEQPDEGEVVQSGNIDESSLNPLTYVFQDFALLPWRTVAQNVSLVLEDHKLSRAARQAVIDDVLARTGLDDFANALPRQLSGGMKQRVGIARALAVRPSVLLMDEPLSALDSQTRELLLDDLVNLWTRQPFAAVYVTHNLAEAVRIGHRVVVLSRRPSIIKRDIEVNIPLADRAQHAAELQTIERQLWEALRDEAKAADRELNDA
jgi:NitT/TauT family transport system ATP-binding protein